MAVRGLERKFFNSLNLILMALLLASCGGGDSGGSNSSISGGTGTSTGSGTVAPINPLKITSQSEGALFLNRATFGGDAVAVAAAFNIVASDWLKAEFSKPARFMVQDLVTRRAGGEDLFDREHTMSFWKSAIMGNDQLRQRMVFALSQIIVVSDEDQDETLVMGYYLDLLAEHAFGNYRDLLGDMTYSPAMADYLTYLRNKKGNPDTGRMPDENYARELLQLFSIGLVELNMDGTAKTDAFGVPIEIYDNTDITGLAKVFTGLSLKGTGFWDEDEDAVYSPLIAFEDEHSELEKSFLGTIITAGTPADESITQALDTIFGHPNVAPFISRQLIQRFTASHPSPAYVERVANAFETGTYTAVDGAVFGTTGRGDMQATLAAILLDTQFFDDVAPASSEGKLREPVLKFVHWARAFNVANVDPANQGRLLWSLGDSDQLGQSPFSSKSVFNFYRPGYIAPATQSGAQNLTAPELQIVNESSVVGYNNFMLDYVFDNTWQPDDSVNGFEPDYSNEIALAATPEALVDRLNDLLLAGNMSALTRERMIEAVGFIPLPDGSDAEALDKALTRRVHLSVYMAVVSAEYSVQF